ncbi:Glyoxalase/Bleomycin resistance protein/Dihydroxybiphenyl dioxygenase [Catenaria anguillulae PL171]|uniref:Methylmalonyl-CoA epimerase, mitochondrial n=1 Tax=Catenaria anguillulae PL171 TaxID=765915 RepID=A0A1Y2HLR7_9FUNG|nr:Glyoxalase/Bleomycin resistance protein/Dihydroxybiphenyl dioxygenase [Catenaria anguillulae PL171]
MSVTQAPSLPLALSPSRSTSPIREEEPSNANLPGKAVTTTTNSTSTVSKLRRRASFLLPLLTSPSILSSTPRSNSTSAVNSPINTSPPLSPGSSSLSALPSALASQDKHQQQLTRRASMSQMLSRNLKSIVSAAAPQARAMTQVVRRLSMSRTVSQSSPSSPTSTSSELPPKSHPVWRLGALNHVAIAVPDLAKATAFYRDILRATSVSEAVALPEHGVYTVFINLGNTKIELLHPYGEKSPIQKFLEKNKDGGIHHVCIEVDNIDNALADITAKGIRSLDKKPKIGAHGKPVFFCHPKDCGGVLVEFEQK